LDCGRPGKLNIRPALHPPHSITISIAILACHGSLRADRASTNYSLTHESTTGTTGFVHTSINYTLAASGTPASAVMTSRNYTLRGGFAGQLIDPTGITIAGPGSVDETGTAKLAANITFDDGTIEPDIPATWSLLSGPLAGVTADGEVTAGTVYAHANATVRADAQGFTDTFNFTVSDVDPDNFQTYARDGLPDFWQAGFFGIDNPLAAPDADHDADRQDNAFEFLSGHDPTDNNSRLEISPATPDTITLSKVIPDRTYQLQWSANLVDWMPIGLVLDPAAETLDQAFTDPAPDPADRRFYRIQIDR
jgi:hypothetical protein